MTALLLMEEIGANQLRLVVYPIIYDVFLHPKWLAGYSRISSIKSIVCNMETSSLGKIVLEGRYCKPFQIFQPSTSQSIMG